MFAFYRTSVGKKFVVALTGLMLFGFVLGHMAGNLKAFTGRDPATGAYKIDEYAHHLRLMGEPMFGYSGVLWILRIGLLGAVLLHIITVIQLTALNRASKPTGYRIHAPRSSTIASRSMFWGGIILLAFIVYHLLHLTFGVVHGQGFVEGHVYANITSTFQVWYHLLAYIIAMLALGLHLFHGVWSLFQSLGFDNPDWNPILRKAAVVFAFVVSIGFISVPIAAFTKLLPPASVSSAEVF